MNHTEYQYLKKAIRWGVFQGNLVTAAIMVGAMLFVAIIGSIDEWFR